MERRSEDAKREDGHLIGRMCLLGKEWIALSADFLT